jgi:hypothetical protein
MVKPKKYAPDVKIGISRGGQDNSLQVALEVSGMGRGAICMSARAARTYADALRLAADKLEEMLTTGEVPS